MNTNLNLIIAVITPVATLVSLFISCIALYQTHKQIKISNKQFLYDKRFKNYICFIELFEIYENNIYILDYSKDKDDDAIIVDVQFETITNCPSLKDIKKIIEEPKNNEYKGIFLLKLEEIKKIGTESKFLFNNEIGLEICGFMYDFTNLLLELYKYQILLLDMTNDQIPRINKPSYKELQQNYSESTHRQRLYKSIDKIFESYNALNKKEILKKVEKEIKL